jgi:hypothetical protein
VEFVLGLVIFLPPQPVEDGEVVVADEIDVVDRNAA